MCKSQPLPVILARRVLTSVSIMELQRVAASLIEDGHDCPALQDLAWDPVISRAEADDLFNEVEAKLGFSRPSRAEAADILVHHYVALIALGNYRVEEGLASLMREAYWPELSEHPSSRYVGDADGLEYLIGAYWNYDDLRDSPNEVGYGGLYGEEAFRVFGEDVRKLAAEWLLRHPTPPGLAHQESGSRNSP